MRAIFLGSFNPPHKGHVACIKAVINDPIMKDIEKIHVIPCWQNPNKDKQIPFIKRYQMVHFMFGDLIRAGYVAPDDVESCVKPTYTYDLLNHFHSNNDEYIKSDFYWIITAETIHEIYNRRWYKSTEILHSNNFIVLYKDDEYDGIVKTIQNDKSINAYFINMTSYCEGKKYHSTELRNKVSNGESIIEETNERVVEYIKDMNLYTNNHIKIGDKVYSKVLGKFAKGTVVAIVENKSGQHNNDYVSVKLDTPIELLSCNAKEFIKI